MYVDMTIHEKYEKRWKLLVKHSINMKNILLQCIFGLTLRMHLVQTLNSNSNSEK